jgi:hypothetical protein
MINHRNAPPPKEGYQGEIPPAPPMTMTMRSELEYLRLSNVMQGDLILFLQKENRDLKEKLKLMIHDENQIMNTCYLIAFDLVSKEVKQVAEDSTNLKDDLIKLSIKFNESARKAEVILRKLDAQNKE